MDFDTVIGLEVHAQLLTRSKMFCRCSAGYSNTQANTCVCPICLGMPGVLPTINQQAVEYSVMTALALNCSIPEYTKFDRKNYPYPDLMKGYQISQYDAPLGLSGWISIELEGGNRKRIGITRVHLEEDVAKLQHRISGEGVHYSLVDVNRAGVPLMEVVGEPDLSSPEEARQYLIKLRSILRYLGVSTGNMEEGSFRCDANISIRPKNDSNTMAKVEVKNMNSFRSVFRALQYEEKRQRRAAEEGRNLIQETRGWVEETGKTVSMRSKEYAHDYRYFPEPDLPPMTLSKEWVEKVRARIPELPEARRERFVSGYGLPLYDAGLLTGAKEMADYFEACLKTDCYRKMPPDSGAKEISNWILGEVSRIMNANGSDIASFAEKVTPERLSELALSAHGVINIATAKSVLENMFETGRRASDIIEEKGLNQITDSGEIESEVNSAVENNHQAVLDYRAGKTQSLKFLVGQVMKATKGRASPQVVNELLKKRLEED